MEKFVIIILLLTTILSFTTSYNILVLVPFPGPSHWLMISTIIGELVERGHHVTAITNFKHNGKANNNYTEILIDPKFTFGEEFSTDKLFDDDSMYDNKFKNLDMYWKVGLKSSKHGLENKNVQNLIEKNDRHFDLVISEQFFQESWLMFGHKYNAPIITIGTYGYSDFMDRAMGLITPWSFVPHMLLDYNDEMTFTQRCFNLVLSTYDLIGRKFYYIPEQDKLAKTYFSSLTQPLPSIIDLEKSISIMLINSHRSTSQPRPCMPGLINIAGLHIKPNKPLPQDLLEFLDNAPEGVIYFSLGAYIQSSKMPKEKVRIYLDAFAKLKQKVLWKWEDDKIPNLPKNVIVRKWMPQSDILAHKNVVLFMTHGGMFGTSEGIKFGIPMLFMPFFGDQHRNALKSERAGYGLTLKFAEISLPKLEKKLNELLNNKIYYNRAKDISELFTDNPITPMEEAMFWIEYTIRHKGAKHLKSAAVNLPWYSYTLLDIFAVFIFILVVFIIAIYKVICGLCVNKRSKKDSKKNN